MSLYGKSLCRSQWPRGLRLACWYCGFESHRGHGCLSVVIVVCCQVEVSATSWSLVQRSTTDCDALLCVIYKPQEWGGHGPRWAAAPQGGGGNGKSFLEAIFSYRCKQSVIMKRSPATYASGSIAVSNFAHVSNSTACSVKRLLKNSVKARTFSELAIIQGYSKWLSGF